MRRALLLLTLGVTAAACSVRWNWPRHQVEVHLTQASQPLEGWEIDALAMTIDRAELIPCTPTERPRGYLSSLLVSTAHAHAGEVSHETLIAESVVVRAPDLGHALGVWTPWEGRYCSISLGVAAARSEARSLGEMLGKSLVMEVTRPDGSHVSVSTTWSMDIEVEFARALELGTEDEHVRVEVRLDLEGALSALRHEDPTRQVMLELREHFEATWSPQ